MPQIDINKPENSFPLVIGQKDIKIGLSKILGGDRLAHAYLFVGPEGSGRLAMALEIARTLNCTRSDPLESRYGCDCKSCRNILRWQHPNLYPIFPMPPVDKDKGAAAQKLLAEILAAKTREIYAPLKLIGTGQILIDQIRELRSKLSLTMDRPGVRTIIVQPAERIRDEAANAFLKLLEEPPDNCCILLISESTRELLPTIVSRCQIMRFPPLPREDIYDGLTGRLGVQPEMTESASRLAIGNFTRAMALAEGDTAEKLEESLKFLRASATGNAAKISEIVDSWSSREARIETEEKLTYAGLWIRDALAWQAFRGESIDDLLSITDQNTVIEKMAARYSVEQLVSAWRSLEESRQAIDDNSIISLALTALAVRIHRILA